VFDAIEKDGSQWLVNGGEIHLRPEWSQEEKNTRGRWEIEDVWAQQANVVINVNIVLIRDPCQLASEYLSRRSVQSNQRSRNVHGKDDLSFLRTRV